MLEKLSLFLDRASEYLSGRKGLLPLIGLSLVIFNLALQFFPSGWLGSSNLFLHLGLILVIVGMLLSWAL
jgi:hypothetical protein